MLGLIDWVPLERVHQAVVDANPGRPIQEIQDATVALVSGLTGDGLCSIGDLTGENSRFVPWPITHEQAIQRLRDEYVNRFDDPDHWSWFCWLDLTDRGVAIAQPIENRLRSEQSV
ncbi:hypothetical protein [Mycobacterium sp. MS1601]|uniref:hypothetical protein n=1 Tax=Mycobacterium sp. MS1601 TaxID=1936029 RepID=UPI0012F872B2|nr:hypothetical protein [Mycobacterium sp. MS1601]